MSSIPVTILGGSDRTHGPLPEGADLHSLATYKGVALRVRGEPLIEIEDLVFRRGDRLIFDGLNMVVPTGKITALMGPSGCGKTTLLRIIGGQLKPEHGSVRVRGQERAQDEPDKDRIGKPRQRKLP